MTFDHVDDKLTREILTLVLTDGLSVDYALGFADQCLQADQHNEDVSFEVYNIRAESLAKAHFSWAESRDTLGTIKHLQAFWLA